MTGFFANFVKTVVCPLDFRRYFPHDRFWLILIVGGLLFLVFAVRGRLTEDQIKLGITSRIICGLLGVWFLIILATCAK